MPLVRKERGAAFSPLTCSGVESFCNSMTHRQISLKCGRWCTGPLSLKPRMTGGKGQLQVTVHRLLSPFIVFMQRCLKLLMLHENHEFTFCVLRDLPRLFHVCCIFVSKSINFLRKNSKTSPF